MAPRPHSGKYKIGPGISDKRFVVAGVASNTSVANLKADLHAELMSPRAPEGVAGIIREAAGPTTTHPNPTRERPPGLS